MKDRIVIQEFLFDKQFKEYEGDDFVRVRCTYKYCLNK